MVEAMPILADFASKNKCISKDNVRAPGDNNVNTNSTKNGNANIDNLPPDLLGSRPIQQPPTPSHVHAPCPALSALLAPLNRNKNGLSKNSKLNMLELSYMIGLTMNIELNLKC